MSWRVVKGRAKVREGESGRGREQEGKGVSRKGANKRGRELTFLYMLLPISGFDVGRKLGVGGWVGG